MLNVVYRKTVKFMRLNPYGIKTSRDLSVSQTESQRERENSHFIVSLPPIIVRHVSRNRIPRKSYGSVPFGVSTTKIVSSTSHPIYIETHNTSEGDP